MESYTETLKSNPVNQLVMATLDARINGTEFYTTDFLMNMVYVAEAPQYELPNRSVLEDANSATKKWQSSNLDDVPYEHKSLSYEEYKYL